MNGNSRTPSTARFVSALLAVWAGFGCASVETIERPDLQEETDAGNQANTVDENENVFRFEPPAFPESDPRTDGTSTEDAEIDETESEEEANCTLDDDCSAPDENPCAIAFCNQGQCDVTKAVDGVACDDGQGCTTGDSCTGGECVGTLECECLSDADCNGENAPVCMEAFCSAEGTCGLKSVLDGTSCDDGDLCTEEDTCSNGVCGGVPSLSCDCSGSGIWLDGEEQCSLQAAIENALHGSQIELEFGQYVLNPAKRDGDLTLVGVGMADTEVSVGGEFGIEVSSGNVVVSNLKLVGGMTPVRVQGVDAKLELNTVRLENATEAGLVVNGGEVTIVDSMMLGGGGLVSGIVATNGSVTVRQSFIQNFSAEGIRSEAGTLMLEDNSYVNNNQKGGIRMVGGSLEMDETTIQGNGESGIHLFEVTGTIRRSSVLSSTGLPGNGITVDSSTLVLEGSVVGSHGGNGIQSLNSSLTVQSAGSDEPVHSEILNNTLRGVWTEGDGSLTMLGATIQGNGLSNVESVGALVTLTGIHSFGGAGEAAHGVDLMSCSAGSTIENSRIETNGGWGIRVDSCPVEVVSNEQIRFNDLGGIQVMNSVVQVTNNLGIVDNTGVGILVQGGDGSISGNTVQDTKDGSGIVVSNASDLVVQGNTVGGVDSFGISATDCSQLQIANNTVLQSLGGGISMDGGTGTIAGNSVTGGAEFGIRVVACSGDVINNSVSSIAVGGAVGGNGIMAENLNDSVVLRENEVANNEGVGIYTENGTVTLEDNSSNYNQLTGIYLGDGTLWSAQGNTASNNGSYGYQCAPEALQQGACSGNEGESNGQGKVNGCRSRTCSLSWTD